MHGGRGWGSAFGSERLAAGRGIARALVGGAAAYPSPISCSASAIGVIVDGDWIVLSVPTVPCPACANVANSNVQRLTVGERR